MEGQLLKYTNVMKGWQTRWFLLDPDSGMLEYFEVSWQFADLSLIPSALLPPPLYLMTH